MHNTIRKGFGFVAAIVLISLASCKQNESGNKVALTENTFTPDQLKDKIKGGWAGQTIGVVYGAPVEFKYQGSVIPEYQNIP
jgi:hypothetical protein